jgi:ABC-type transport system, involved in lipoprotein release, permease component
MPRQQFFPMAQDASLETIIAHSRPAVKNSFKTIAQFHFPPTKPVYTTSKQTIKKGEYMLVIIGAIKSIVRAKGRNILIGIIALVIAAASCVSLSISSSADKLEKQGIADSKITATIGIDPEYMQSQMEQQRGNQGGMGSLFSMTDPLPLSDLEKYSKSGTVEDFYYSMSASLNASGDLLPYGETAQNVDQSEQSADTGTSGRGGNSGFGGGGNATGGFIIGSFNNSDFTLSAYSSEQAMKSFFTGETKMVEDKGSIDDLAEENTAVISKSLATYNNLDIGSEMVLQNPNNSAETYTLKIVGLYAAESAEETGGMPMASMNPANTIITSPDTLNGIAEKSKETAVEYTNPRGGTATSELAPRMSATYVLANAEALETFNADIKRLGLAEGYKATSSDIETAEKKLVPLQNLKKFAGILLLVVLLVGAVVLFIINMFNIRERKYEVGVMTAMGIKKGKVALQFMLELLIVSTLAVIVGTGIGAVASQPVSNELMKGQIAATLSETIESDQAFGRPGGGGGQPQRIGGAGGGIRIQLPGQAAAEVSEEDYQAVADKFVSRPDTVVFARLIGITALITLISSLAGIMFIMRYNPLKILSER